MDFKTVKDMAYLECEHSEISAPFLLGTLAPFALAMSNSSNPHLREGLPNPFDLFDHLGNAAPSLFIGAYLGAVTTATIEIMDKSHLISPQKLKAILLSGSLALGAAVNLWAESKYGSFFKKEEYSNVVDSMDWIWGTASTVLGARLVNRFRKRDKFQAST